MADVVLELGLRRKKGSCDLTPSGPPLTPPPPAGAAAAAAEGVLGDCCFSLKGKECAGRA